MPVAPRIVNDVSYVMDIMHETHFDACCSAHCK